MAFSSALREVSDEISKQLRSKDQTETAEYILLYGKYEPIITNLGSQVEQLLTTRKFAFGRTGEYLSQSPYFEQYHQLFKQILGAYLKSRDPVSPLVLKNLRKFTTLEPKPDTDFESFARRCIQYVLDICHNEKNLVSKFFHNGPLMMEYPSPVSSSNPMDYARRLDENTLSHLSTLHAFLLPYLSNGDLERICRLVNWLETTYMTSLEDDAELDHSGDGRKFIAQELLGNYLWKTLDLLFLKTASEIEHFKPSPEDLKVVAKSTAPLTGSKTNSNNGGTEKVHMDTQTGAAATPFPTVQTAVKLLIMYNDGTYDRPVSFRNTLAEKSLILNSL